MSQCCYNISCVYRYIPVRAYLYSVLFWLRFLWSRRPRWWFIVGRTSALARSTLRRPSRRLGRRQISYTVSARRSTGRGEWVTGGGENTSYANVCTCSSVHLYVYCILLYMHINAQTEKECKNKCTQRTFRSCACACPPHKT